MPTGLQPMAGLCQNPVSNPNYSRHTESVAECLCKSHSLNGSTTAIAEIISVLTLSIKMCWECKMHPTRIINWIEAFVQKGQNSATAAEYKVCVQLTLASVFGIAC